MNHVVNHAEFRLYNPSDWGLYNWGHSSGVERSTADRQVPGSNPGAPYTHFWFSFILLI